MKELVIIRGPSGSGKTTFAEKAFQNHRLFEADQLFTICGAYLYDPKRIGEAHAACQAAVAEALIDHDAKVVVANTFVKLWEMRPYQAIAKLAGAELTIIRMGGYPRPNVHNVPEEVVKRQIEGFEPSRDEIVVHSISYTAGV